MGFKNNLGRLLKEEREEARLSLEKAAEILKVRREYLEDIENDNYQKLPPEVYIRGFLKSYAILLNLSPKKLLEIFDKQQREVYGREKLQPQKESREIKRFANLVITPELFFIGSTIVLIAAILIYFVSAFYNVSRPPSLEIFEPKVNETVSNERLVIAGQVDDESNLNINDQEVNLKEEGFFEKEIILMEGINKIHLKAQNKFEKVIEKELIINYIPNF